MRPAACRWLNSVSRQGLKNKCLQGGFIDLWRSHPLFVFGGDVCNVPAFILGYAFKLYYMPEFVLRDCVVPGHDGLNDFPLILPFVISNIVSDANFGQLSFRLQAYSVVLSGLIIFHVALLELTGCNDHTNFGMEYVMQHDDHPPPMVKA